MKSLKYLKILLSLLLQSLKANKPNVSIWGGGVSLLLLVV